MPKVSIGIPTYNSEKFLAQAIESVLSQTYTDFELIVSDDGSNDNTDSIVSFYAEKDKRIRYLKNSNRLGLFGNFNNCIEHSSGEYINILGHDDVMLPRNIQVKTEIFEQYSNIGLVASSVEVIDADDNPVNLGWGKYDSDALEVGKDWVVHKVTAHNPICCPFVFLRRSVIEKSGLFNSKYPFVGDFDMWLRVAIHADVYLIHEVLGRFRWHETNESHKYDGLYYLTEVSQIWDEIIERLNLPFEKLQQMENRILTGLSEHFILAFINHDLNTALQMSQVLDCWRGRDRQLSIAIKLLGKQVQELNQSLYALHKSEEILQSELLKYQSEISHLQNTVIAMESSKFWKSRIKWFKIKRKLGLE